MGEGYESMEQHTLKNVNNCLNTNIYSYLETSGGQSYDLYINAIHFWTPVLIRHLLQLKAAAFLQRCLICALLLSQYSCLWCMICKQSSLCLSYLCLRKMCFCSMGTFVFEIWNARKLGKYKVQSFFIFYSFRAFKVLFNFYFQQDRGARPFGQRAFSSNVVLPTCW